MIPALVGVLKSSVRPGSVTGLLLLLAAGLLLTFWRRTGRHARWYFMALFLGGWILTTPACAERLVRWRSDESRPIDSAADARGARIVVILGGGSDTVAVRGLTLDLPSPETNFRLLEGARLFRLLDRPTVVVSGGVTSRDPGARPEAEAMRTSLVQLGVPRDAVLMEIESVNTYGEAPAVRRLLGQRAIEPIVLVTSPMHMARSLAVFRAAGFNPVPSPSAYKSDRARAFEHRRWLPSDAGLALFDAVVYETAATWYYRARGWMR